MASWTRGRLNTPAPSHRTHAVRSLQLPQVLVAQEPLKHDEQELGRQTAGDARMSIQHMTEGCLEEVEMLVMHGNFGPGSSTLHLEAHHGSRPMDRGRLRAMKHARHKEGLHSMQEHHHQQPVVQQHLQQVQAHAMLEPTAVLMPPSSLEEAPPAPHHTQPAYLSPHAWQHELPGHLQGHLPVQTDHAVDHHGSSTHHEPSRRHSRSQARTRPAQQLQHQPSQSEQVQAPLEAIQLTQQIVAATSISQLHQLFRSHAPYVNYIHVCAGLKRLQRIAIPRRHMPPSTSHSHPPAPPDIPSPSPAHPGSPSKPHKRHKQRLAGSGSPDSSPSPAARELHSLVMLLANLTLHHLPDMRVKEVAAAMMSLVKLKAPVRKSFHIALMTHARHKLEDSDTNAWALAELLSAVAAAGMQGLRKDWSRAYFRALSAHWQQVDVRCTFRILHALGTMQASLSPYWSQQLLDKLQQHVCEAHPQDVSNALWAITRLQLPASVQVLDGLCTRAHQLMPLLDGRELAIMLWSLAKMEHQSSEAWQQASLQLALRHIGNVQGHSLALMLYSLALLRWPVPGDVLQRVLERVAASRFAHLTPQGLGLLIYSVSLLGHVPSKGWMQAFHAHVSSLTCQVHPAVPELIRISFSSLGFQPPRIVSTVVRADMVAGGHSSGSGSGVASGSKRSYTLLRPVRQHMYSPSVDVEQPSDHVGHLVLSSSPEQHLHHHQAGQEQDGQGSRQGGQQQVDQGRGVATRLAAATTTSTSASTSFSRGSL